MELTPPLAQQARDTVDHTRLSPTSHDLNDHHDVKPYSDLHPRPLWAFVLDTRRRQLPALPSPAAGGDKTLPRAAVLSFIVGDADVGR